MPSLEAPRPHPLDGLYAFVRDHLAIVNAVVVASGTLVGALDFLAPRLSLAPVIIYSMTACLTLVMLLAAFAPGAAGRLISIAGGAAGRGGATPLWRRPAWQVAFSILLAVSIIGFSSVAKASQGGIIASQFPAARAVQEQLLGLRRDVADIKQGVDSANGKLDILVGDSKDPKKDLVASGYSFNDSGLMQAIKQGDARAVGLFAKAGYLASYEGPMAVILNGDQPWRADVVALLPKSMFAAQPACREGSLLNYELKPPAAERVAAFKRLCEVGPWVAMLRSSIAEDQLTPSPNEQWTRYRAARKANLALLTR